MLEKIIPTIDYPSAFSNWLRVFLHLSEANKELAITGKNAQAFATAIYQSYYPNVIVAVANQDSYLPFLEHRFDENKTLFYVCHNKTCLLPTEDFDSVKKNLGVTT